MMIFSEIMEPGSPSNLNPSKFGSFSSIQSKLKPVHDLKYLILSSSSHCSSVWVPQKSLSSHYLALTFRYLCQSLLSGKYQFESQCMKLNSTYWSKSFSPTFESNGRVDKVSLVSLSTQNMTELLLK